MTIECKFYITHYHFLIVDIANVKLVKLYRIKYLEVN